VNLSRVVGTILDAPLQAWCWIVCRPGMPRRSDGRPPCVYECYTGSPGNALRTLLWWIVDHSAFWREGEQQAVEAIGGALPQTEWPTSGTTTVSHNATATWTVPHDGSTTGTYTYMGDA
jgi:hypothetical protein